MKGLEALDKVIKTYFIHNLNEELDIIEKELKALEIIKAIKPFFFVKTISGRYCLETIVDEIGLTKDNYEILKEVLL